MHLEARRSSTGGVGLAVLAGASFMAIAVALVVAAGVASALSTMTMELSQVRMDLALGSVFSVGLMVVAFRRRRG